MHPDLLTTLSLLVIASLTLIHIPKSFCQDQQYVTCGEPVRCGNLTFNYPFWGGNRPNSCGYPGFEVTCESNVASFTFESVTYRVLKINGSQQSLTVARDDLFSSLCPEFIYDTTFNYNIFRYSSGYQNVTLSYGCTILNPNFPRQQNQFDCRVNTTTSSPSFYSTTTFGTINPTDVGCSRSISVPVKEDAYQNLGSSAALQAALNDGFGIQWEANNSVCDDCTRSGGICGHNSNTNSFACYCSDRQYDLTCNNTRSGNGKAGKAWIWAIVSPAIVVVLLLTGLLCFLKIRRHRQEEEELKKRNEYIKQLTASDSFDNSEIMEKSARDAPDLKIFSFGAVVAATDNFSSENKLGQGGFGPVYKGKLLDGREIAVKRLSNTSGQGLEEFKNELILISKLQHTNLVRVLGCCLRKEEKMLIYEYMPNKSLDFFLFAQDKKERLDWQKRFNIIDGVAQGLLYLHKYSRMRVIHRDLKASNILLDENMNPKIADFGMARIFKQNVTEAITNRVVGTYGYMSPEYAMEGTFSIKSDVFSFGVLTLEIVSGRKNSSFYQFDRPLNLIGYAWELWKEGMALVLKDPTLGESCDVKQLLRTIHIGLLCVQESATDRPTMPEVISMLNNDTMALPVPNQPAFFTGRKSREQSEKKLSVSVNDLSFSLMEPR